MMDARQEAENEWEAQNKAVIDTRGVKKLSSKIPKNMPYFAVEFGLQVHLFLVVSWHTLNTMHLPCFAIEYVLLMFFLAAFCYSLFTKNVPVCRMC